jgi:hypothetical protein
MGEKIKKYAIVVFLTFLVWAWAYNEQEKTVTRSATLDIAKNLDSDIYVTLDPPAPIEMNLTFKGTPTKINYLKNQIDAGQEDLKFIFNPENQKKDASSYTLNVLEFLHDTSKLRKLELTIEENNVEEKHKFVQVKVEKLVEKELKIRCVDGNQSDINVLSINPPKRKIFVKPSYTGDAIVELSDIESEAARKDYTTKKPFVRLAANDIRQGAPVQIKLPSKEFPYQNEVPRRIGYSFGKTLMGKYSIELKNKSDLTSTLVLKASPEAFEAYQSMDVHIFVVALDGDASKDGIIERKVIYNFPPKYFAKGEIRLAKDDNPGKARFKLIPLTPKKPTE